MRQPRHAAFAPGFTLIELIVTLSVLTILVTLALPSFALLIARSQVTVGAQDLFAALQLAKHEAVRRNGLVQVCGTVDGSTCSQGGWHEWVVRTRSGTVLRTGSVSPAVTVASSGIFGDGLAFDSAGMLHGQNVNDRGGSLTLCNPKAGRMLRLEASGGVQLRLITLEPGECV